VHKLKVRRVIPIDENVKFALVGIAKKKESDRCNKIEQEGGNAIFLNF
jgi:hypothetical protein